MTPAAPGGFDALRIIHRALRGRYRFTIIVSTLIAIVGFSIGWQWAGLLYRSDGMVRIASALPPVLKATDQNQPIPMFDSFIQAQQELLTSRSVLEAAAGNPIWKTGPLTRYRLSVEELAAGLKVETRAKSENLRVSFTSAQAHVAVAAVQSTIAAYQDAYMRDHAEREQRRLRLLEEYRASLVAQLEAASVDPNAALMRSAPTTAPAGSPTKPTLVPPARPTARSLALIDPAMRQLLEAQLLIADQIDRDRLVYGQNHPNIQLLEMDLELAQRRVDRYVDDQYARMLVRHEEQERQVAREAEAAATDVALPAHPVVSPVVTQLRNEIEDVSQRIEILKTEAAMPKRFEVVKNGEFPVPVPDRRIKTAAMGAMGGAGAAISLMIIAGLFRRQYNYCADVVDDLAAYTPYVAAIPEIATGSGRHATDAVQCIHHLRQTLETGSRAYLVSSAYWGSGQSSVLMSLAMSMAASGVRTLIIDADIQSRGLTTALGLQKDVGFADVLAGCELEYCLKTNRAGLSILPAGRSEDSAGYAFTQAQFAQLLEVAKRRFDVVLVDAAPLLAEPESATIARCVDGVLFTLARGQSRKLVNRALADLMQARANVIGAVFNRVARADYDLSVPQRARAMNPALAYRVPSAVTAMGPLVQAMAQAIRFDLSLTRYIDPGSLERPRVDVEQQNAESIAA